MTDPFASLETMASRPQCQTCFHKSRSQCPECGGAMGHPSLGLAPCPVCPHGTRIGRDFEASDTIAAGSGYFHMGTYGDAGGDSSAAVAEVNMRRRANIDMVLQARPDMLAAVEQLLSIQMGS